MGLYRWNSGGQYRGKSWEQDLLADSQVCFDLKPQLNVPTLLANIFWMATLDVRLNVPTFLANILFLICNFGRAAKLLNIAVQYLLEVWLKHDCLLLELL